MYFIKENMILAAKFRELWGFKNGNIFPQILRTIYIKHSVLIILTMQAWKKES